MSALDLLDVHLESGEILARWGAPAPLRWFLHSYSREAEQEAWANRVARRAGGSVYHIESQDDWEWLLEDMLKLSGSGDGRLKGAFCLLSKEKICRIYLSGLLSSGGIFLSPLVFFMLKKRQCLSSSPFIYVCVYVCVCVFIYKK